MEDAGVGHMTNTVKKNQRKLIVELLYKKQLHINQLKESIKQVKQFAVYCGTPKPRFGQQRNFVDLIESVLKVKQPRTQQLGKEMYPKY